MNSLKKAITLCMLLLACLCFAVLPRAGEAASYSYLYEPNGNIHESPISLNVFAYNVSQGFTTPIKANIRHYRFSGNNYYYYLDYELPDDGSTYKVLGNIVEGSYDYIDDFLADSKYYVIDITVTTPGTFTGVSIGQAVNAANNAASNASSALSAANSAKTAATNAQNNTWDSDESKSAATLAKEARDKADTALTNINTLNNTVNNIQASLGPQIQKINGLNMATCTTRSSMNIYCQASGATEFRVCADTGSWSAWTPVGSYATATGMSAPGAHTINVEARNASGAVATGQITVFKI